MAKRTRSYVNEAFHQILSKPFVKDVLILNSSGDPIKMTMKKNDALQMTGLYNDFRMKVENILEIFDPNDKLIMLRIRSDKDETFLVPDDKISIIAIQKAKDLFQK